MCGILDEKNWMNSPSGLKDSEVILGGLLYPLESDSMDKSDWYSETLFGLSQGDSKFIVDGICLDDIPDDIQETKDVSEILHHKIMKMVKTWNVID